MRTLLRLHTAIVGRSPSQGPCQSFGGLLPRQNRHFAGGKERWCSTQVAESDKEKHTADLVLEANFEPTTYPGGCDKDDYRSYFNRSRVYVLGVPLKDGLENVAEMIRGLRPDAVVLMPLVPDTDALDRLSEMDLRMAADRPFLQAAILAYREAKALPRCTVVCDGHFSKGKPLIDTR